MTSPDIASLLQSFPGLATLPQETLHRVCEAAQDIHVPAGTRLFGPGQPAPHFLLLRDGKIRVSQMAENGREIALYRVSAGDTCILTSACLIGFEDQRAEGIAETDLTAIAVPRAAFDVLIATSPEFRQLVFRAFNTRITDLFRVIDDIAAGRIDARLASLILTEADGAGEVVATHQQLAVELGTAREVVSRQLADFQRRGWITTRRGGLAIKDRSGLAAVARAI